MQRFGRGAVGVHQYGDLLFRQDVQDAQGIGRIGDGTAGETFNRDLTGINGLGERDSAPHGQGLGKFRDDHPQAGMDEADGDACGEVPAAANEDDGCHGDIKPQIWDGGRLGGRRPLKRPPSQI